MIWQTEPPFSVGANLKKTPAGGGERPKPSAAGAFLKNFRRAAESAVLKAARTLNVADQLMAGKLAEVEQLVEQFQFTTQQLKYSMIPTVAAVDGFAFGGGCEFLMHCDRAVTTLESYIGLVEVGVGLLPAGGGCKEFVLRAEQEAKGGDAFPFVRRYFESVATAQVSRSGEHAREIGYLRPSRPHRYESLRATRDCQGRGPHARRSRRSAAVEASRYPGARVLGGGDHQGVHREYARRQVHLGT